MTYILEDTRIARAFPRSLHARNINSTAALFCTGTWYITCSVLWGAAPVAVVAVRLDSPLLLGLNSIKIKNVVVPRVVGL